MVLSAGNDANSILSTALEKLLYLESRLEASEAARDESARLIERLRGSSAELRRGLGEWQRRATQAEVSAEGAEREAGLLRAALEKSRSERPLPPSDSELARQLADAEARLERFEREREAWLDRMVALARLRSDASPDDELDLGSFIAELRAELMALRRGEKSERRILTDRPAPPDADALIRSIPAPKVDPDTLVREARLPKPVRTLAQLSVRDLESDTPSVRRRAAERLLEAGVGALNPFVAEKLAAEPDPHARAAYVQLIDRTGTEAQALVLAALRRDPDVRVRAAVVEALGRRARLDLLEALSDPSPAVRRRVIALLPRGEEALEALEYALCDDEASVRRVALLALSSRPGLEAQSLLRSAAHSGDEEIARLARESLERRGLPLEPPPVDEAPLLEALPEPEPEPEAELPPQPEPVVFALDERVMDEVRAALRGRTLAELELYLEASPEEIAQASERLVAAGVAVWRGPKLYPS